MQTFCADLMTLLYYNRQYKNGNCGEFMNNFFKAHQPATNGAFTDEECLTLAIQTVLFNNKEQILSILDSLSNESFLSEMSKEIVRRAHKFKHIAESVSSEIPLQAYDVKGEAIQCIQRSETRS